jgi:hypothetical protein
MRVGEYLPPWDMGIWETVSPSLLHPCRGGWSTGNLHINVVADKYDEEIEKVLEPYIYEIVCRSFTLWVHIRTDQKPSTKAQSLPNTDSVSPLFIIETGR